MIHVRTPLINTRSCICSRRKKIKRLEKNELSSAYTLDQWLLKILLSILYSYFWWNSWLGKCLNLSNMVYNYCPSPVNLFCCKFLHHSEKLRLIFLSTRFVAQHMQWILMFTCISWCMILDTKFWNYHVNTGPTGNSFLFSLCRISR